MVRFFAVLLLGLLPGAFAAPLVGRQAANSSSATNATSSSNSSFAPYPEYDSFYHASNFASSAPGTVLDSRRVNTTISRLVATGNQTVEAYQVSYVTSGPDGQALTAVTTIWKPTGPSRQNSLIAYSLPEDSSFIDCAPSYSFLTNADPDKVNTVFAGEAPIIASLLILGFTVQTSDYQTNEISGFGSGPLFARGVLDGARAALNFNSSGLDRNATRVGAMGYSGGSIATTWAMAYAPTYAPELNIVGFATGGTPANLTANTLFLEGTVGSGFNFIGTAGLAKTYSKFGQFLSTILTKTGFNALYYATRECLYNVLAAYPGVKLASSNYTTLGDRLFYAPEVQEVYKGLTLGVNSTLTPNVPGFAVQCTIDMTVPEPQATKAWADLCSNGLPSLTYQRDNSSKCAHADEWIRSMPQAIDFILARFNGTAAPQGCNTDTFNTPRVPSADAISANTTTLFGAALTGYGITNSTASTGTPSASASGTASSASASGTASAAASSASASSA